MRQRVRRIVVAAPPSVVLQWKDELEQRFGLTFVVFDRDYVRRMRQERGFGVNPWTTHSRFIVSHHLLRDEDYASPLRDWLGRRSAPRSLLILDEAHNAAPASGARYADRLAVHEVDPRAGAALRASPVPVGHAAQRPLEQLLGAARDPRPAALLPRRAVEGAKQLDAGDGPPAERGPPPARGRLPGAEDRRGPIDGLAADAPELLLPQLLDEYRQAREERLKDAPKSVQNAVGAGALQPAEAPAVVDRSVRLHVEGPPQGVRGAGGEGGVSRRRPLGCGRTVRSVLTRGARTPTTTDADDDRGRGR